MSRPLRTLLAVAVLAGLTSVWGEARRAWGVDFFQFRAVGWTVWTTHDPADFDVYSDAARHRLGARFLQAAQRPGASRAESGAAGYRRVFETYSTPFLYTVFGLFGVPGYDLGLRSYQLLCLGGLVFGVFRLCRLLGYRLEESMVAVLVFSAWFEPSASDLRVANVNSLQLALLTGYLALRSRARTPTRLWLGGAILGLGVVFKPNLAVVVAVLMLSRLLAKRRRGLMLETVGMASGAAAALILSSWCFGTLASWYEWVRALSALPAGIVSIELGNVALSRLIQDSTQLSVAPLLGAAIVGLAFAALWSGRSAHASEAGPSGPTGPTAPCRATVADASAVGLGCLVMLLASSLVWLHYMVMTIPMALVLLAPRPEGRRPFQAAGAALAVLALAGSPLVALGVVESQAGAAGVVCAGALLLYALGLREVATDR